MLDTAESGAKLILRTKAMRFTLKIVVLCAAMRCCSLCELWCWNAALN
nr:MAG TPA: hypothetical protein [Caudoviricetes sp.]